MSMLSVRVALKMRYSGGQGARRVATHSPQKYCGLTATLVSRAEE